MLVRGRNTRQTRRLEVASRKKVACFRPESQMRNPRLEVQSATELERAGIPARGGEAKMGETAAHRGERRDSRGIQKFHLGRRGKEQRGRRASHDVSQERATPEGDGGIVPGPPNHGSFQVE